MTGSAGFSVRPLHFPNSVPKSSWLLPFSPNQTSTVSAPLLPPPYLGSILSLTSWSISCVCLSVGTRIPSLALGPLGLPGKGPGGRIRHLAWWPPSFNWFLSSPPPHTAFISLRSGLAVCGPPDLSISYFRPLTCSMSLSSEA